jgi:hypothetical protein
MIPLKGNILCYVWISFGNLVERYYLVRLEVFVPNLFDHVVVDVEILVDIVVLH